MSSSKITLIGFTRWMEQHNTDLFQNMLLPQGIDKDILCNNILMQGGEFEVMFSDPYMLQASIGYWCRKHYRTFDKWIKALNIDYEPLYNYDRYEKWTDTGENIRTGSRSNSASAEDLQTNDLTRTDDLEQVTDGTIENLRSAMDSAAYQPHDESNDDTTVTNTGTVTDTGTIRHDISSDLEASERETGNSSGIHDGHLYGNIGVVTSQKMLEEELNISRWNIYEKITDIFLLEFTIPVY